MTKKELIITMTDGTQHVEDLMKKRGLPFGAPANDMAFITLALEIARTGWISTSTNKEYAEIIAPSQIKKVEIKFT